MNLELIFAMGLRGLGVGLFFWAMYDALYSDDTTRLFLLLFLMPLLAVAAHRIEKGRWPSFGQ